MRGKPARRPAPFPALRGALHPSRDDDPEAAERRRILPAVLDGGARILVDVKLPLVLERQEGLYRLVGWWDAAAQYRKAT